MIPSTLGIVGILVACPVLGWVVCKIDQWDLDRERKSAVISEAGTTSAERLLR